MTVLKNGPNSFMALKKLSLKTYSFKNDTFVNFGWQTVLNEKSKSTSLYLYYEIGVERYLKFCPTLANPERKELFQINTDISQESKIEKIRLSTNVKSNVTYQLVQ